MAANSIGTDAYRFAGQRICSNTQVRTDLLETAVSRLTVSKAYINAKMLREE